MDPMDVESRERRRVDISDWQNKNLEQFAAGQGVDLL
jgi:hypothetical protein